MEDRYIAAVDMGTWKIALTVAKITGEDVDIVYYKERPSDGIRNSAVFNPGKAEGPIREAIKDAEEELKIKIMQVVVGLPRCDVRQEIAQARVERTNPDESITREEVENLKALAQDEYPLGDPDKDILYGAVAQSFSDDENFQLIENDIIGVISQSFEGNFKLFIGKKGAVRTIDKIFNDLGIAIARKYFTPSAQAKAVLTEDEMIGGVGLIDLGAGATSVTIYQGNILRYYASVPYGGNVITSDIRTECSISPRLAENIKYAFGACMPEKLLTLGEKTIQIEGNETEGFRQIPVKYLSEIITARVKEILDAILYEIQASGMADSLRAGLVITGGGAKLANIVSYIKEVSGYNVRTGKPRRKFSAEGIPGIFEPSATTSVGMILSAKEDGLLGCIDPVERPAAFVTAFPSYWPADPVPEETAEERPEPQPETESEPEAVTPEIPEDAEEGVGAELFSSQEVPETEPGKKKVKEPKAPKKPGKLSITWKKLLGFVDEMTNDMDNEEV
ncbi:MAG: cell division protein FtsA [Bacteroidales bacterium]|nr:cell division protein FtsA [Bacteroidales bacterium]